MEDPGCVVRAQRLLALAGLALLLAGGCSPSRKTTGEPVVVDATRLEGHVRMLSETFRPRDYGHPGGLDKVADYIRIQCEKAGGRVTEQAYEMNGATWRNVLVRFGPEVGSRIVVGAHYDAYGDLPGADDNASGVAGLIELAGLLGRIPPKAPVELVAYTLEEPPNFRTGNMGSARHAADLKARNIPVRAMLCLEMIGFFADQEGSQRFPVPGMGALYPGKGDFITVVGDMASLSLVKGVKAVMQAATSLPVESLNAPRAVPGVDFSDHFPYWDAGFPAVMITDTADNRNLAYHTAGDTADRLDYRRMGQVVQGVYAVVMDLAQ